jgi:hypothetical protein
MYGSVVARVDLYLYLIEWIGAENILRPSFELGIPRCHTENMYLYYLTRRSVPIAVNYIASNSKEGKGKAIHVIDREGP